MNGTHLRTNHCQIQYLDKMAICKDGQSLHSPDAYVPPLTDAQNIPHNTMRRFKLYQEIPGIVSTFRDTAKSYTLYVSPLATTAFNARILA